MLNQTSKFTIISYTWHRSNLKFKHKVDDYFQLPLGVVIILSNTQNLFNFRDVEV